MKPLRPTQEEIAGRAYEIYERHGSQSGHDRDDWLQSEYELMHLPLRILAAVKPRRAQPGASRKTSLGDLVHAQWFTLAPVMPFDSALAYGLSNY